MHRNVGYDARRVDGHTSRIWCALRERGLLIRPDCKGVLSVDLNVWPSIFTRDRPMLPISHPRSTRKSLPLPEFVGPFGQFWSSYEELTVQLDRSHIAEENVAVIEVRRVTPGEDHAFLQGQLLLGYDVADEMFISSLTDMVYTYDQMSSLRSQFSTMINIWHLFTDKNAASQFAEISNALVQEHSPFHVFSIGLILRSGRSSAEGISKLSSLIVAEG